MVTTQPEGVSTCVAGFDVEGVATVFDFTSLLKDKYVIILLAYYCVVYCRCLLLVLAAFGVEGVAIEVTFLLKDRYSYCCAVCCCCLLLLYCLLLLFKVVVVCCCYCCCFVYQAVLHKEILMDVQVKDCCKPAWREDCEVRT